MIELFNRPVILLRATAWDRLLGLALFMLAVAFLLGLAAHPGSLRAGLRPLALYLALGLLAAKLVAGGYGGPARMRAAAARGEGWGGQCKALLPPPLLMWTRTDCANLLACLQWLARRPFPPHPAGVNHPFLDKSSYRTVILCGLLSILVELPLDGLIASVMTPDPELRRRLQWLLAGLGVYSLMWILGDRRQMLGGFQVVGTDALELNVGARLTARVPLVAIMCSEVVGEPVARWCERHGASAADALLATPADGPNVMLGIDPQVRLRLTSWNVERDAPRYLFLFADAPAALVATINARIKENQ